jgi:hypothetical protein
MDGRTSEKLDNGLPEFRALGYRPRGGTGLATRVCSTRAWIPASFPGITG